MTTLTPLQQAQLALADAIAAAAPFNRVVADAQALVTALTPVSPPPSPPPPPPVDAFTAARLAAGQATVTLQTTNFGAANAFDQKNTQGPGFQWYALNAFVPNKTAPNSAVVNADGSVTTTGDSSTAFGQLCTAIMLPGKTPNFHGTAFGGGFAVEMDVMFDPTKVNSAAGWPSGWTYSFNRMQDWANSTASGTPITAEGWPGTTPNFTGAVANGKLTVSGLGPGSGFISTQSNVSGANIPAYSHITGAGTGLDQYGNGVYPFSTPTTLTIPGEPMQASGVFVYMEINLMEAPGTDTGWPGSSPDVYFGTVHLTEGVLDVWTLPQDQDSQAFTVGRTALQAGGKVQFIWTPSPAAGQPGTFRWFFNGAQVGQTISYMPISGSTPPWATGQPYDYGSAELDHWPLILSGSAAAPMKTTAVTVWQRDASKNLTA